MRAVGVIEFGGPDALQVVEVEEPHAGPGQVRVLVHAATVNPTDTFIRNGARAEMLRREPPPYVPGMDAAGIVDEVGDGVTTGVAVGDRVMAVVLPHGSHGAYSEKVVLPAGSVVRAPAGTTHAEASTLPMNGLTARLALDLLALAPGQVLGVTGAAGAVGGYVIQLAKADSLTVVADASEADQDLVRALGADVVVRRGEEFARRVREVAPGGVDGLVDAAVQGRAVLGAVRDSGTMAVVRGYDGPTERGITIHPVWVRNYAEDWDRLDRLRRQAEEGVLTLRVAQVYPAARAAEAHRRLESGGTRGRLVIEF